MVRTCAGNVSRKNGQILEVVNLINTASHTHSAWNTINLSKIIFQCRSSNVPLYTRSNLASSEYSNTEFGQIWSEIKSAFIPNIIFVKQ